MLTMSKAIGATQATAYRKEEFANAQENYYTEGDRVAGAWHGQLAREWGLAGDVHEEHFARLAAGQHPITGEQLVRHQTPREYLNARGELVKTMEHRAGWDGTFSAPKSVSLTGLVGGDVRVNEAHRESVTVALDAMQRFVQARMGGNRPAITTGRWVVARFEHDSSRPVNGYAAPQLHTHCFIFNLTELPNGEHRALQPQELYRAQQYATAVYRNELARRLRGLGYEIERGKGGAPEVAGYSRAYLEASSPRSQQIKEHLAEHGLSGAGPAQIAAHRTREDKLTLSHEDVQKKHQEMAAEHGHQPRRVIEEARERAQLGAQVDRERQARAVDSAITYSREHNIERQAVAPERDLMKDALNRAMGEAKLEEVQARFEARVRAGELKEVESKAPDRAFTTPQMISAERDTIDAMRAGQGNRESLVRDDTRQAVLQKHAHLNGSQRAAVDQVLSNRDRIMAIDGVAGAGKTTSLQAIAEAAKREGYEVKGLAPTSGATRELQKAGVESTTLQRHLSKGQEAGAGHKNLYVLDESSLAGTKQMNEFVHRLGKDDRVLLVGDTRQHEAVEAGRPFQQLQEAGMQTAKLDEIVRQKDPALKEAVEQLSRGEVREAVQNLDAQGRVHEIPDRGERLQAIAREYAKEPQGTLVVSPDNESRRELNGLIHREMQQRGVVDGREQKVTVLDSRQELSGADRAWAGRYETGDVIRYSKGSKAHGIEPGEYARVVGVNKDRNEVTVKREDGKTLTYDPRRLQGVSVYKPTDLSISRGDRVQFTAPSKELGVSNRELGTVEKIERSGEMRVRMDSGRTVDFNVKQHPHLDRGYAVTSHSSQGQTSNRVLLHADASKSEKLVNRRMGYVAVSRARNDVQVFTNDKAQLGPQLSREAGRSTAIGQGAAKKTGQAVDKLVDKAAGLAVTAASRAVSVAVTTAKVVTSKVVDVGRGQGQGQE